MPYQQRPLTSRGQLTDLRYLGHNWFLLDREHPETAVREAVAEALDVCGIKDLDQRDLPRFLILLPELVDDEDLREKHRDIALAYAQAIQATYPALARLIRLWLQALAHAPAGQRPEVALEGVVERGFKEPAGEEGADGASERAEAEPAGAGAGRSTEAAAGTKPQAAPRAPTGTAAPATPAKRLKGGRGEREKAARPRGGARQTTSAPTAKAKQETARNGSTGAGSAPPGPAAPAATKTSPEALAALDAPLPGDPAPAYEEDAKAVGGLGGIQSIERLGRAVSRPVDLMKRRKL
jgi:hypothetical protein